MGIIPGCPVLYQGLTFQFPDATCQLLVSHSTLGYVPSVRTWDTLEWDTVDYLIVHLDGTAKNLCIKLDMHKALVTLV